MKIIPRIESKTDNIFFFVKSSPKIHVLKNNENKLFIYINNTIKIPCRITKNCITSN